MKTILQILALLLLIATPTTNSFAAGEKTKAESKKEAKALLKQLKKMDNPSVKQIKKILAQIVELDPKKAAVATTTALAKVDPANVAAINSLTKTVTKALEDSGLSSKQIDSLTKKVEAVQQQVINTPVTPASPTF